MTSRRLVSCGLGLFVALWCVQARAQNKYLCCDLAAGAAFTVCASQAMSCAPSAAYSVTLSDVVPDDPDAAAVWVNPLALNASFPDGNDGAMYWTTSLPHLGFCLVAPVPGDPTHVAPVEPIGCLEVSLKAGVSAEIASVVVPMDPRWDAYQICYGASDPQNGCQNLNDGWSTAVSETPTSHSCCGPAEVFRDQGADAGTWQFVINEALPGIPPPVLVAQGDAGFVPYFTGTSTDGAFVSTADAGCLTAYNESILCGTVPPDASTPSPSPLPETGSGDGSASAAQGGGGGGGCSVGAGPPNPWLLLPAAALFLARSRRGRRPPPA